MLTCIRKAFALIDKQLAVEKPLALHSIPPDDSAVYDMICRADTLGVFKIESRAQMSMLPRLKPRCFYDIVIEVAIVRPGPIQGKMVHPYLRRRSGKESVTYPNKRIADILERTLGVPIFQEQVMELAVVAAGFTPGEADELRRAMAAWKKKGDALLAFERRLISGMLKNGYTNSFARSVFEQIRGFGEYGFPQSHAASFAHLVYVSAWLKQHFAAAFAASLINSQPMGFYQSAQILDDAKRHGVIVRPIDINFSCWDCTLENDDANISLRLGMRLIKGIEQRQAERIWKRREQKGPYSSLLRAWRESGASVETFRLLAKADAFRSLNLDRQHALWALKKFRDQPLPLFENNCHEIEPDPSLPFLPQPFHVLKDYEATGLSLKAHPVSFLRHQLSTQHVVKNSEFKASLPNGSETALAGLVLVRQRPMTASGMVFMTIEDETGMANIIIKPHIFQRFLHTICDSTFLLIHGRIQKEDGVVHLIARSFTDLSPCFAAIGSMSRDFH